MAQGAGPEDAWQEDVSMEDVFTVMEGGLS